MKKVSMFMLTGLIVLLTCASSQAFHMSCRGEGAELLFASNSRNIIEDNNQMIIDSAVLEFQLKSTSETRLIRGRLVVDDDTKDISFTTVGPVAAELKLELSPDFGNSHISHFTFGGQKLLDGEDLFCSMKF